MCYPSLISLPARVLVTTDNSCIWSLLFQGAVTPAATRWDETPGHPKQSGAETPGATPSTRLWDATPGHATPGAATPGRDTPSHDKAQSSIRRNRWDETPKTERGN